MNIQNQINDFYKNNARTDFPGFLRIIWILAYSGTAFVIVINNFPLLDKIIAIMLMAVLLQLTEYGYKINYYNGGVLLVYSVIGAYFSLGYAAKFSVLLYVSELSWLSEFSLFASIKNQDLLSTLILSMVGLICMIGGQIVSSKYFPPGSLQIIDSNRLLPIIIMALLVFRFFAQTYFNIGIPGKKPVEFGVPFLSGIIAFLTGPIIFLLSNINLYLKFYFKARRGGVFLALVLVFVNVLLDLYVGYKQALVWESVILLAYYFSLKNNFTSNQKFSIQFGIVAILLVAGVLYKYINLYRFALLSGQDIFSAIGSAIAYSDRNESNFFMEIFNRINGIDNFYAAVTLSEGVNFSIRAILDDELVRMFVGAVLSDEDAVTTFGLTQFGALNAVGGLPLMIFGGFLIGYLVNFVTRYIFCFVTKADVMSSAYAPILALFFIKFLFAGGQIILYSKELIFSLMVITLLLKFLSIGKINSGVIR